MQTNNNDKLFYLVWHNIYIRSIIINHLKLFNIYVDTKIDILSFNCLKKKEVAYYKSINFISRNDTYGERSYHLIPDNVEFVEFPKRIFDHPSELIGWIPSTVKSLKFNNRLKVNSNYNNKELPIIIESFPNQSQLVYLDIGVFDIGSGTLLPSTLKTFKCSSSNLKSFNLNCLPISSITKLDFNGSFCENFKWNKGETNNLSSLVNLKSLCLGQSFKSKLKVGSLPMGLLKLKLPTTYNAVDNLKVGSVPNSVTSLQFQKYKYEQFKYLCKPFKVPSSILPLSLVKLKLGENHYLELDKLYNTTNQLHSFNCLSIKFDALNYKSSIPSLKVLSRYSTSLSIPTKIKSLSLTGNIQIVNPSELVNLTCLKIDDYKYDKSNYYHPNMPLVSLSINFEIDNSGNSNALSQYNTLRSLSVDKYNDKASYPPNVSILEIFNSNYYPIDTNLLPSSIHTIIIHSAEEILFPLTPNIKRVFVYPTCYQLVHHLNLFENLHLLSIFKIVDPHYDIFKKLSNLKI